MWKDECKYSASAITETCFCLQNVSDGIDFNLGFERKWVGGWGLTPHPQISSLFFTVPQFPPLPIVSLWMPCFAVWYWSYPQKSVLIHLYSSEAATWMTVASPSPPLLFLSSYFQKRNQQIKGSRSLIPWQQELAERAWDELCSLVVLNKSMK